MATVRTVDSFVVIYEPADDGITILLVIHGAQHVPRGFQKRFL